MLKSLNSVESSVSSNKVSNGGKQKIRYTQILDKDKEIIPLNFHKDGVELFFQLQVIKQNSANMYIILIMSIILKTI